ncbi:MAG: hypothetical protein EOM19_02350 [Candidatus Moranbacteria bacterium]|nr:hypothetical protein [Candidatus Moranbacteria bacterium]
MQNFEEQINQIKTLNTKYKEYWEREFEDRDYSEIIANPDSFENSVFYHQANSEEEKNEILENGFDFNKVQKNNCGVGGGLYLGRDKKALINFYDPDWNSADYTIKIIGDFNYYDGINNAIPKNPIEVVKQGFDGIRYYDPDATGEEFVLFNISKAKFTFNL